MKNAYIGWEHDETPHIRLPETLRIRDCPSSIVQSILATVVALTTQLSKLAVPDGGAPPNTELWLDLAADALFAAHRCIDEHDDSTDFAELTRHLSEVTRSAAATLILNAPRASISVAGCDDLRAAVIRAYLHSTHGDLDATMEACAAHSDMVTLCKVVHESQLLPTFRLPVVVGLCKWASEEASRIMDEPRQLTPLAMDALEAKLKLIASSIHHHHGSGAAVFLHGLERSCVRLLSESNAPGRMPHKGVVSACLDIVSALPGLESDLLSCTSHYRKAEAPVELRFAAARGISNVALRQQRFSDPSLRLRTIFGLLYSMFDNDPMVRRQSYRGSEAFIEQTAANRGTSPADCLRRMTGLAESICHETNLLSVAQKLAMELMNDLLTQEGVDAASDDDDSDDDELSGDGVLFEADRPNMFAESSTLRRWLNPFLTPSSPPTLNT